MTNDLDKIRDIFLSPDVDEESREENRQKILEWEQALVKNKAFLDWKEHDTTREIMAKAREQYKDLCMHLISYRLNDDERNAIYAKVDAILWLLSLTKDDPKAEIERIHGEIRAALQA